MGSQFSSDIKYVYTNINGNQVSIPYVRIANGQWVPLYQYQDWYNPHYNQRLMSGNNLIASPILRNGTGSLYPYYSGNDYYVPNQSYFNGFYR